MAKKHTWRGDSGQRVQIARQCAGQLATKRGLLNILCLRIAKSNAPQSPHRTAQADHCRERQQRKRHGTRKLKAP